MSSRSHHGRRSHAATHASQPAKDGQLLRGRDVAITCRDRSRCTASDDQPAPRLLTGPNDVAVPRRTRTIHVLTLVAWPGARATSAPSEHGDGQAVRWGGARRSVYSAAPGGGPVVAWSDS